MSIDCKMSKNDDQKFAMMLMVFGPVIVLVLVMRMMCINRRIEKEHELEQILISQTPNLR